MRNLAPLALCAWLATGGAPLHAQAAAPLPATILPETMGKPSFDEKFNDLDAGPDQTRPAHPHRWRTVFGSGGPASVSNRSTGGLSLGVDREFRGSDNGAPIGIDPFSIDAQGLTITARRVEPAMQPRLFGRQWASGQLTTKFSFAQKYGYFEAEMDLPTCQKGVWPAFWLLPPGESWPLHGEIDFPETVGNGKIYWTAHTGEAGRHDHAQVATAGSCTRGWHHYGVLWRPDSIGYYYDRHLVGQTRTPADYVLPMYIIINLTVGGAWPGPPDPSTTKVTMGIRQVTAWPLSR
jgi:hypothetical protein